jgi:hypothetical protein
VADAQKTLSTQAIESIGRGHLVGKLIREGIGISIPIWDDGVDLIAHSFENDEFTAVPLQLKVSTNTFVGVEHKYRSKSKIKLVFCVDRPPRSTEKYFCNVIRRALQSVCQTQPHEVMENRF